MSPAASTDAPSPDAVLDAVAALLADLRHVRDSHALERRLCDDAAATCGVTRVMLSRVEADAWRPWEVSGSADPDADRHFGTHLRGVRIAFATSVAEERARRELRPVTFDPAAGHGATPLPLVGRTGSYVVLPLVGAEGLFGLLHADHHPAPRAASPVERDALWLLADGFSLLYERAVLGERLHAQQARIRRAAADVETGTGALLTSELGLDREAPHDAAPPDAPAVGELAGLTRRQRDVAELLARGWGNAAIARDLVIAEGTVKTHVKAVMRKLGAATRAEAIAALLGHRTRS